MLKLQVGQRQSRDTDRLYITFPTIRMLLHVYVNLKENTQHLANNNRKVD